MTALLELPGFRERVHPMAVETYHRLGQMGVFCEKVELLRGIVVTKMSKSPLHELVCQKLMKLLLTQVPDGFEVRREGPLTLRKTTLGENDPLQCAQFPGVKFALAAIFPSRRLPTRIGSRVYD